jgi:hypothetical protein
MIEDILSEAGRLVGGDRNDSYGDGVVEWNKIADIFSTMTGKKITASEAVLLIMVMKLVREAHKPKRDNLVDLCGYALIASRIQRDVEEESQLLER